MLTIEQVRTMLFIQKHRLDDELEIQAEIQDRISVRVSELNTAQLEAKDNLARIEAELFTELKDSKVANELANAEVRTKPERVTAWRKYQSARQEYEQWLALLEAWRSRGYHIKVLADLYMAQYFTINSVSGTADRRLGQDKFLPRPGRAEMRAASTWTPPVKADSPAPAPAPLRRRTLT